MGIKAETLPNNLIERRFRSYWERTEKAGGNERQRFAEVLKPMQIIRRYLARQA